MLVITIFCQLTFSFSSIAILEVQFCFEYFIGFYHCFRKLNRKEKNVLISVIRSVALINLMQLTPEGNYLTFQKGLLLSFNQTFIVLRPVMCAVDWE